MTGLLIHLCDAAILLGYGGIAWAAIIAIRAAGPRPR